MSKNTVVLYFFMLLKVETDINILPFISTLTITRDAFFYVTNIINRHYKYGFLAWYTIDMDPPGPERNASFKVRKRRNERRCLNKW